MYLTSILRFLLSFRPIAATLLIWISFSTQSIAWQQVNYNPYPTYAAPVNYYNPYAYAQPRPNRYVAPNYPRYNYPTYNYPPYYQQNFQQPGYYAPQPQPSKPAEITNRPVNNKVQKASPDKTFSTGENFASKQQFIDNLLPYIDKENARLKRLREQTKLHIHDLEKGISLSEKNSSWLKKLAKKFRVKGNPLKNKQARKELLRKVDIIPSSLTLAQAANESAWGKSRFATEANNLFGIWTYDESKGLKPQKRDSEKKHLVRIFEHYGESVAYYMHTLNSHPAYKKLREIRQQQRHTQKSINGLELANGLEKYSEKGDLYIKLIRSLIRQNEWVLLDNNNHSV